MHAKILAIDTACNWHQVKHFHDALVNLDIAPVGQALLAKVERFSHFTCFVVPSEQHDTLRVSDLHGDEIADNLGAVWTTIDVVTQEDPIRVFRLIDLIQLGKQVIKLSMHVAKNVRRAIDSQQVWLLIKQLFRPLYQLKHDFLGDVAEVEHELLYQRCIGLVATLATFLKRKRTVERKWLLRRSRNRFDLPIIQWVR